MEDYSKLSNLAISDTGFVFNPVNGDSFTLNPTAKIILKNLKESKNKNEILDIITSEFDVSRDEAEKDLDNFVSQLSMHKLV
jgi:PqqD family protein of HPr-rel-A system